MIGYITLGTNDLPKSGEYFDKLFAPLGAKRILELPHGIFGAPAWQVHLLDC